MDIKRVKKLLKSHGVYPSKGLGQNFLIDGKVMKEMIETAQLSSKDTVLEVGPGIGNLTWELAKRAKKVIAVEKDQKMVEILKEVLKDYKNVEIIHGDVLKILNTKYKILNTKYKVVANLPYYITSPTIRYFLESVEAQPQQMVLMVQKEVAQRICAKPPEMSLLAVSVQFYAKPEIVSFVSKKSFWPKPKVDSAILKVSSIKHPVSSINKDLFFKVVRAGFSHPRKQLINNLSKGLKIEKEKVKNWLLGNGIQPTQRAQNLTVENWINLAKNSIIQ